ncbi:MAG: hypothetical protein AB1349_11335 [Elusimicrobiota bacterium]
MSQRDKLFFLAVLFLSVFIYLSAQESSTDSIKGQEQKSITIEPFCQNLSQAVTYWQLSAQDLQLLKNKGLGYSEVIKVILIAKKIEKLPDEIVKRRQRGETFKKICERYKIDYNQIKFETKKIKSEVKLYGTK